MLRQREALDSHLARLGQEKKAEADAAAELKSKEAQVIIKNQEQEHIIKEIIEERIQKQVEWNQQDSSLATMKQTCEKLKSKLCCPVFGKTPQVIIICFHSNSHRNRICQATAKKALGKS